MKFIYASFGNEGGVYKLTNTTNGRFYIGSTYRFKKRFPQHLDSLLKQRHANTFLQNDFNKCKPEDFIIEILEVVQDSKQRLLREQFYLNLWYDKQTRCYNLRPDVCDTRKGKKQNEPCNPLTDKRCQPHDEQHKAAIGQANKQAWQDPALREQAAEDANKRWNNTKFPTYNLINNLTGEKVVLSSSLRKWCMERGFNYKAMHLMVSGKTKTSCGGWKLAS